MATIALTMNACGGSATTQKIYYGKATIVSGSGISGTGWTLYTGAPISAATTSVNLTGLDDNVEYIVQRFCNCPTAGDTGPEQIGPLQKKVCGSFPNIVPASNAINFTASIPTSVNSAGSWITQVVFELFNQSGTTLVATQSVPTPVSSSVSGSLSGLTPNTNYILRMVYYNAGKTKSASCSFANVTTLAACSAPSVTLSNVTTNSMQVSWSVSQTQVGDTYNIIRNGVTVATGLPISSSPYMLTGLSANSLYQIGVQRNCGQGGTATGNSSTYTQEIPSDTAGVRGTWDNSIDMGYMVVSKTAGPGSMTPTQTAPVGSGSSPTRTVQVGTHSFNVAMDMYSPGAYFGIDALINGQLWENKEGSGDQIVSFANIPLAQGDLLDFKLVPYT